MEALACVHALDVEEKLPWSNTLVELDFVFILASTTTAIAVDICHVDDNDRLC